MSPYTQHFSTRQTSQDEPIPGKAMTPNSAGGYSFTVDDWTRLDRFLILGCEGGSYYATEKKLTVENASAVLRCLDADPRRTVQRIVDISVAGRAPKNDPAIFALAIAAGHEYAKDFALGDAVRLVCRTGTHLFQFVEAVQNFRGWGRGLRRTISSWYTSKPVKEVAYQCAKYQSRNGWSHRDLLRLSKPANVEEPLNSLFRWVVGKQEAGWIPSDEGLAVVTGFEKAKKATTAKEVAKIVHDYELPRECVPTQFLTDCFVWEALLEKMPLTAMIRNLATMTRVGLLAPLSAAVGKVVTELTNAERLKKSRVHPIQVLAALLTYRQGHGERGQHTWNPVAQVTDALDAAFYASFGNVTPTNKKWMLALDVSGSMEGGTIAGVPGLTPRVGSAAMAMITAAVEKQHVLVAFTSNGEMVRPSRGFPSGITMLNFSPRQRLDDICNGLRALPMGGTDCALPMLYAMEKKLDVDVFSVYCVDEETEILTENGWKNYNSIKEGDEVYTLDHETGNGEWQKITAVNVFPAVERDMILMEGRGHSSLTTIDHRWPVRHRGNRLWGRRWKTSTTLNNVDYVQCAALDKGLPTEPTYEDSFVELVAWAWTEGNWNQSNALSISQSDVKNPENCDSIRAALVDFLGPMNEVSMFAYRYKGIPLWVEDSPRENSGVIYWRINQEGSKEFAEVISNPDKIVSLTWLRKLTKEQLEIFIQTSLIADGDVKKNRLAQKLPARAEAFAFACILAGKPVSMMKINNDHHSNYLEVGILQRYQLAPLQHHNNKDKRPFKVVGVKHNGVVWCPTTPNGTWLARRKGTVYWTGNTDSETWAGNVHPVQALNQYRQKTGNAAKLVVCGMVSSQFSIADPDDAGMLDCVGFDTSTPQVMADFVTH